MNLQLNSPYKECPYSCPFCCAKSLTPIHNEGENSCYYKDKYRYLNTLHEFLDTYWGTVKTVVLTGGTEPTLFEDWITDVLSVMRWSAAKVELQTRNHSFAGNYMFNTIAYSTDVLPENVLTSNAFDFTRTVFILNKKLSIDDIINYHLESLSVERQDNPQTTVKNMVENSYGNESVNEWIRENRVKLSPEEIKKLEDNGIWYDNDCSNSEARYMIYRTDGNFYQRWSDTIPMEQERI